MKATANDKSVKAQMMEFVYDETENIVGKRKMLVVRTLFFLFNK